ncbi:MAG: outer membrane protein assembly factor BamD [Myxococcota bacterium]|jgi:outer membrane protein assembly factor BamD
MKNILVFAVAALIAAGCAHTSTPKNYSQSARENYELGEAEYKKKNWLDAIDYFNEVRNKFPYALEYVVKSELRLADAYFEDEKYSEASESYRLFVKLHPTNEKVAYAMFRIGMCSFKQMPKDWFFMPPTYEEDQTKVVASVEAMSDMVVRFPDAPEAKEARVVIDKCRLKLAKHELYVAEFYFREEKWKATQARAEGLLRSYSGLGLDDKTWLLLVKSLVKQGLREAAEEESARFTAKHPGSKEAAEAALLVGKMRKNK